LHELGHSLVAQHYGVQVRDITLWPIGGVARVSHMPSKPSQEFLMTAAGPATNLVLALLFGAMAFTWIGPDQLLRMAATPRMLNRFVASQAVQPLILLLAINNLVLALFNLIPAFPMDGGRLLRSGLGLFLSFRRATQLAAILGQVLAAGMVVVGLLNANFILSLIGVFVFVAAWQERRQVLLIETLKGVPVRLAMRPIGPRLSPGMSLAQAASEAAAHPQPSYLIVEGGELSGVLVRDDLLRALRKHEPNGPITPYVQRTNLLLSSEETLDVALQRVSQIQPGLALVVEGGQVIGTIDQVDLVRLAEILRAHPTALQGVRK
jgi:stage IV sporulation protein FB